MLLFKCKACCCETSCMLILDDEYVDLPNQCPFYRESQKSHSLGGGGFSRVGGNDDCVPGGPGRPGGCKGIGGHRCPASLDRI